MWKASAYTFPCSTTSPLLPSAPCLLRVGLGTAQGTKFSTAPYLKNHQSPEEFSTGHRKGKNMHNMLFTKRKLWCDAGCWNPLALFFFFFPSKLQNLCSGCCHPSSPRNCRVGSHAFVVLHNTSPYLPWKDAFISHYPHDTGISHKRMKKRELLHFSTLTDLGFKLCTPHNWERT